MPFPAGRRDGYIRRHAHYAATFRELTTVTRYFRARVGDVFRQTLRAGVAPAVAQSQSDAMWFALWAEYERATSAHDEGDWGGAA